MYQEEQSASLSEEENRRLKRMYADLALDHELLKEVLEKKL